ncbi:MAG: VWA domain-containing protein [Sandaracinaceae bacterium]|nr:MAG: VWA domain-containing protein [Sandaracinaceae bacterium]
MLRWTVPLALLLLPLPASAQHLLPGAPEGVRETSRSIHVELAHGLAMVTTRVVLESDSDSDAPREAIVRIPTPLDAGLAGMRACLAGLCRRGRPDGVGAYEAARSGRRVVAAPLATVSAHRVGYGRAAARELRVAITPLRPGAPFTLEVRYVASASTRGGVVSFQLPDQGSRASDPPVWVSAEGDGLEGVSVRGVPGTVEVATDAVVAGRLPEGAVRTSAFSFRCGDARCVRYRVAAGPLPTPARDVFFLLDASPSSRAFEEGRRAALDALPRVLPGARVRAVAFGSEATEIAPDARLPYLGPGASFAAAWDVIDEAVARSSAPLVVLVGDGELGPDSTPALRALVESGATLSFVRLRERPVDPRLEATVRATLGATLALPGASPHALRAFAAAVVAPSVELGAEHSEPLRAGEEIVFERRLSGTAPRTLHAFGRHLRATEPHAFLRDGLAVRMAPDDPRARLTAAAPDAWEAGRKGVRAARGAGFGPRFGLRGSRTIRCHWGCGCEVRGSASRESIARVRRRLRPRVTACFAQARAGRIDWAGQATLSIRFQYGEVRAVTATASDPDLAACLRRAPDHLADLPDTDAHIEAHFPYHSTSLPSAPPVPLGPSTLSTLRDIGVH